MRFLSAAGIVVAALLVRLVSTSGEDRHQPLVYSHKVHIENAGLTCVDCHTSVETLASATIPALKVCKNCHSDQPVSESPEEAKLLKYIAEGTEIPWKRIYELPDHVYFSHHRHVVGGSLQCTACHGMVAQLTESVSAAFLPVTMENCMECHNRSNVTNDCLACHR